MDEKETKKIRKFLKKGHVKSVFDEYEDVFKYFFRFYCRAEDHTLGEDLEENLQTMDYREFIRFGF